MNILKIDVVRLLMILSILIISSCGDKNSEVEEPANKPQELLIGKWECKLDAYGDPWDEPLIMMFDLEGTGYQWFSDELFSDRWEFNYVATSSKLKIQTRYGTYELRYEVSSNGKTLILYGWDDNDMEELWFTRLS